jgi:hypothetical protein
MIEPNSNERIASSPVASSSLHYNTLQLGGPAGNFGAGLWIRTRPNQRWFAYQINEHTARLGSCGAADRSRSLRQFTNHRFGRFNHYV